MRESYPWQVQTEGLTAPTPPVTEPRQPDVQTKQTQAPTHRHADRCRHPHHRRRAVLRRLSRRRSREKGNVDAPADSGATLSVSDGGVIEGSVAVPNVILNGTVKGDILAHNRVELGDRARRRQRVLRADRDGDGCGDQRQADPRAAQGRGRPAKKAVSLCDGRRDGGRHRAMAPRLDPTKVLSPSCTMAPESESPPALLRRSSSPTLPPPRSASSSARRPIRT